MRGRIASFDEQRGDGWIETDHHERYWFHCVDIADGSRSIEVGAAVIFRTNVGHRGRDEAAEIHPDVD